MMNVVEKKELLKLAAVGFKGVCCSHRDSLLFWQALWERLQYILVGAETLYVYPSRRLNNNTISVAQRH